ncbi:SNAP25 homologous protein SNAP33 [Striga hermonthica]|uniref:SNAP25 homologous protein SNAP33 n=1 Tax=Striga hermonthica TaxID=68872 RepID=A0A9N7P052_STRHE|nr:SNAP25 homologous protein SNAP33 [Striga hermonthica]
MLGFSFSLLLQSVSNHNLASPRFLLSTKANPFDSADELDNNSNRTRKNSGLIISREPSIDVGTNPFDESPIKNTSLAVTYLSSADKSRYQNDLEHDLSWVEKVKPDVSLLDLSNLVLELKDMAVDMGSEIVRQKKALDRSG